MGKREHDKVYEFIMKRYKQRAEPTTVRIAANALHMKEDNIANILEHMTEQGRVITIGKRTRPQQYWPPIAGKNIKPERDIAANTARLKHDLEALIDRGEATGLNVHNFQLWTKLRVLTVIGRERREDDSGDYEVWRKQGLRPDSVNKSIPLVAVVNANRLTAHLYPDGVLNITNSITQNPLPLETEAGMDNVLITLGQWREALAEKFSLHHSLPLPQEWILKQADFAVDIPMKGREIRQIPEIDIPIRNAMGQFKMYTKYLEQNKVLRVEKNDHTTGDKPIMEALNEGRGTKKTILESARKKVKALKIDDVNPDSLVTSAAEALKQQRDSGK